MQRIDRDGFKIDKRRRRGLAKGLVLFAAVLFLVFGAGGAYADQVCSDCHDANPSGLCHHGVCDGGNCAACHGNPPVDAGGLIHLYADQPSPVASGSVSAGAHSTHATPSGQNYGCGVCHYNGMSASSGQLIGGTNNGNGILQMGFAIPMPGGTTAGGGTYDGISGLAYPYEATNGTTVTTGGAKTCSSIYCHSDGTSVSTGAALTAASPGWNTPGPLACTTCHGYPPSYVNGDTKANSHMAPGHNRQCNVCHSATTSDGTTITDPAKHANAVYDVLPADASVDFSYTYDAAGGTCSVVACHGGVALQWGAAFTGAVCELCHTGHTTGHMATDGSGHPVPGTCTSCHTQYASNGHTGATRDLSNSCGACHVTTGLSFISHSSVPMTAVPGQCKTCHPGMITTHAAHTGGTQHTLTTEATCTTCHSATPRVRPTAAMMGACTSCHGNKQDNHASIELECSDCHLEGGNRDINDMIRYACTPCHGWAPTYSDAVGMHSGGVTSGTVKRVSGAVDSYYLNLADGLNAAVNGDIFYLRGIIFNESVIYDKAGVTVTLKGGYDDSSFTLRSGTTLIGGSGRSLTISAGTVIVDGIVIY